MLRTVLCVLTATQLLAGAAVAGELSDSEMDMVTAGAGVTTRQLATAIATWNVTTAAYRSIIIEANTWTNTTSSTLADKTTIGSSTSESFVQISATND